MKKVILIVLALLMFTVMKMINGKYRDIPPLLYGISAAFLLTFVLPFL
jgi:xanthine/uracil/vitamin C permease (AzgA family)